MRRSLIAAGCGLVALVCSATALADNPASGTTSSGQTLNVSITGPNPATPLAPGTASVPVSALASLGAVPASTEAHLAFVIDQSGSLGQANFDIENNAALALYNQLLGTPGIAPYTSLIYFATTVQVEVNDEPAATDSASRGEADFPYEVGIHKYIGGDTYTKDAVNAGITQLAGKSGIKQIILITDGVPNPATTESPTSLAGLLTSDGIQVYIYAVGPQATCSPLQAIATSCTFVQNFADLTGSVTGTTPAGIASAAISVNGGSFAPATLTGIGAINGTAAGLLPGPNTVAVQTTASDGTQVTADETVTVDVPPDTSILTGLSGTVASSSATFTYAGTPASSTASFVCSLDGATPAPCPNAGETYTGLSDGQHTFQVSAVDAQGYSAATPARATWTVDTTPPDTSILSGPSGTVASSSATFTYAGTPTSDTTSFVCSLDGATATPCPNAGETYTGLSDGQHTFQVSAVDAVGNTDPTPASATWTVDTTPPDTSILSAPSGTVASHSATFTYAGTPASDTASFVCSLDGATPTPCPNAGEAYTGLSDGQHTFQVSAVDAVGNTDPTPARATWTVGVTTAVLTSPINATYGTPVTLTATLINTATNAPVADESITFATVGLGGCSAFTNAVGVAGCTVTPLGTSEPYTASFAGDDLLLPASSSSMLSVARATPTISWTSPAPITVGTALSATQLDATASGVAGATLLGSFSYNPPSGTTLAAGAGQTLSVTFTPNDQTDYTSASATVQITVNKLSQVIQFTSTAPTNPLVGATYTVAAKGGASGNPVTFSIDASSTPGSCSISGAKISFTGAGGCLIDANQAGNTSYAAAPTTSQTVAVVRASQTIAFTSTPPTAPLVGGTYTVTAKGGASGNAVTFSIDATSTPGACSLTGAKVSFTGPGSCVIDANQAGSTSYAPAPAVSQTLSIKPTAASVCALTVQYLNGSANFKALPPLVQGVAMLVENLACQDISAITARSTPAQKAVLVAGYEAAVTQLVQSGWLTSAQAATLDAQAAEL